MPMTAEEAMGREARFRAFVRSHRDRAVSLAWRLAGGDPAAAEDIAQEAFAQAWRALPGFREEAMLSTWFFRILVRQAHAWRRRAAVKGAWARLTGDERAAEAPRRDRGLERRIAAALDDLSRGQREAFVMVHLEGFTVVETAAALGRSPGTIKSHLHRALARLRVALADVYAEEEGPHER